jgi:hypothetical protein
MFNRFSNISHWINKLSTNSGEIQYHYPENFPIQLPVLDRLVGLAPKKNNKKHDIAFDFELYYVRKYELTG